jgi:hypothetical protein
MRTKKNIKSPKDLVSLKKLILFLLFTVTMQAQIHPQDENRFSIQLSTDNVVFQKGLFFGGIEFQAEFSNGIYIRPQIHYCDLTDGYLETSAGIGYNLAYNRWNYKGGVKLGIVNRAASYPIIGVAADLEYHITDKIGIGLRGSYDMRGDACFYGGKDWVYNSQGYIKFVL